MDARIDFNIGWDFAAYGLHLPAEASLSVREGYAAGQSRFPRPISEADRYVRKWLQLRHNASKRKRLFEEDVTPEWLRQIDVTCCPVTDELLTHSTLSNSDWSIDRIVNDGSYARRNIAVMSTRANQAKGNKDIVEICALGRADKLVDGLTGPQWYRLAGFVFGSYVYAEKINPLTEVYPYSPYMPPHVSRSWAQTIQYILMRAFLMGQDVDGHFSTLRSALSCKQGAMLLDNLRKKMQSNGYTPSTKPTVMLNRKVFGAFVDLYTYYWEKIELVHGDPNQFLESQRFRGNAEGFQSEISLETRGYTT